MVTGGKDAPSQSVNPFREVEQDDTPADSPRPSPHQSPAFQFIRQLGQDLARGEFDLPPFPDTALKVQECIRDPDGDIQALAAIVATEPALAARLMRMANSAMMRRGPIEVTDIPTAISRVGMDMVQNAAVSFAAREAFQAAPGSACIKDLNRLRRESVQIAAVAYVLGKQVSAIRKPDEAMLAGLLNAVGKYYIFMKASDHPDLFSDRNALEELVSQWHTGVARAIVEFWNFPESIAQAVDEQELVERDPIQSANLSDVLHIAGCIVRGGPGNLEELGKSDALARLRMSAEKLAQALHDNRDELQSMVEALSG